MPALPACIDAGGRAPALFNAQAVGAIPTLRGSDRDCGGRRKPIGSNIPKPTCPTCAQEHEARCGTAKAMKDRDSGGCTRAPGARACRVRQAAGHRVAGSTKIEVRRGS